MSDSPITAASPCETPQAVQIIQADTVTPQAWRNGGGQTRELLVWPPPGSLGGRAVCVGKGGARAAGGGHGAERSAAQTPSANQTTNVNDDWQLRISRADIQADGPFSAFAGVQRWFVVLSGKGVVLHMPTADGHTLDHQLLPGHAPLHFDGGLAPGCSLIDGATQDLNLMARGGQACMQAVDAGQSWSASFAMRGLYTACSGLWSDGQQNVPLAAHSLLWIADAPSLPHADFRFTANSTGPTRAWWLGYTPDNTP
jgi:environmental stress-induced protein Ves